MNKKHFISIFIHFLVLNTLIDFLKKYNQLFELSFGDWGLGMGDWGWGIGDWAQSPIPNPQSPIPNPHKQVPIIDYIFLRNQSKFLKIKNE